MVTTVLVLLGTAVRLGHSPGEASFEWIPVDSVPPTPTLDETRRAVDDELARRAIAETPLAPEERIDPNTAPAEQLERLPGIGPAKAFAIVEERRRGGPYRTAEELARVPGIGPALLQRISPRLTLRRSPIAPVGASSPVGGPVDINSANRTELMTLPGIGPARADSILAFRERAGGFSDLDQLLEIPGIGAAVLRGLQGRAIAK